MVTITTVPNAGKRLASTAIDYLIIFAFTFGFVMVFGKENPEGGKSVTGAAALVPMLFWVLWLIIPEAIWGTTLGHRVNELWIVSMDGTKADTLQIIRRRICDAIEIVWCFGLIAYILIKNTQYNQRLGDIWAKTLVIEKSQISNNEFDFEPAKNVS